MVTKEERQWLARMSGFMDELKVRPWTDQKIVEYYCKAREKGEPKKRALHNAKLAERLLKGM